MFSDIRGALPPGDPSLLGVRYLGAGNGANVAVYVGHDQHSRENPWKVELCLFDKDRNPEYEIRFQLTEKEPIWQDGKLFGHIWHGTAREIGVGSLYGFRVHGPYAPRRNQFFSSQGSKLLLDPYALEVSHEIHQWPSSFFHSHNKNHLDSAASAPKGRVVDVQHLYDRAEKVGLGKLYSQADTIIFEMHVKGGTIRHDNIPFAERGKYSALAHPEIIRWAKQEMGGITSFELMPIGSFTTDPPIADNGKKNFWGYQPIAPLAPYTGYASGDSPLQEIADTILNLRQQRIEVILDVVPNHTGESGSPGPVVSMRGMDNWLYLKNEDYTGTGNTRDFGHPMNIRHFLEELRHWAKLGVSGFRIDLATVIGRKFGQTFNFDSEMLEAIRKDPMLSNVKFYGEPWDIGGDFRGELSRTSHPKDNILAEWNGDKTRDVIRDAAFGKNNIQRSDLIRVIAGSYLQPYQRVVKPGSHDDATLYDFVSKLYKDNSANGEPGDNGNPIPEGYFWGNANDRLRTQRFAIALTMIANGVPLLVLGHDREKSQSLNPDGESANTNPYCQDNDISYVPWADNISETGNELMKHTAALIGLRRKNNALRRGRLFTGNSDENCGFKFNGQSMKDVTWLDPSAKEMHGEADMNREGPFAMMLSGDPGNTLPDHDHPTRAVNRTNGSSLFICINQNNGTDAEFTLPDVPGMQWNIVHDSLDLANADGRAYEAGKTINVGWRSVVMFEGVRVPVPQSVLQPVTQIITHAATPA